MRVGNTTDSIDTLRLKGYEIKEATQFSTFDWICLNGIKHAHVCEFVCLLRIHAQTAGPIFMKFIMKVAGTSD